jgi:UDPglucose 6-dehydrogenase
MRVTVIGSGYVGLVTALCFAEIGHQVVAIESEPLKLKQLQRGNPTIHERFVPELLKRHLSRSIRFTNSIADGMQSPDAVFVCVGTASVRNGASDLSGVFEAIRGIAAHLRKYTVIVEKSTVAVGTGDKIRAFLLQMGADPSLFSVACNPEFLRESSAVNDFLEPDRIVLGTDDPIARDALRELYRPLIDGHYVAAARSFNLLHRSSKVVIETSVKSAELIKQASNAFLATKVSFINAIADIAEATGADIDQVAAGVGADPRIGSLFLSPGLGFGGSCFPKDVDELRRTAERNGICFDLLSEVQRINAGQRQLFLDKLKSAVGTLPGRRLAVLGLSFKGGTDDVRCSPALAIVKRLLDEGAFVSAYDPAAMDNARHEMLSSRIEFASSSYAAMAGADALLILTDWPDFARLELRQVRKLLASPIVVDGRNLYRPDEMRGAGLQYISIGRPAVPAATDAEPAGITRPATEAIDLPAING